MLLCWVFLGFIFIFSPDCLFLKRREQEMVSILHLIRRITAGKTAEEAEQLIFYMHVWKPQFFSQGYCIYFVCTVRHLLILPLPVTGHRWCTEFARPQDEDLPGSLCLNLSWCAWWLGFSWPQRGWGRLTITPDKVIHVSKGIYNNFNCGIINNILSL